MFQDDEVDHLSWGIALHFVLVAVVAVVAVLGNWVVV